MTTIEQYRGMLPTNKHRLDDELEIYADIQGRINDQVVLANSRAIAAKDELASVSARIYIKLKDGDAKLTQAVIEAEVQTDIKRMDAWNAYQKARAEHEAWQGLLDAWKAKAGDIKGLGYLYGNEYWRLDAAGREPRRNLDAKQDELRATLRRSGHQDRMAVVSEPEQPTRRHRL